MISVTGIFYGLILGLPILTFSGPENALWLTFSGPNFSSVFELVIFFTCRSLEKK